MRKILFLAIFITSCGNDIYYLDSYNYNQSGESSYETKQLESFELKGASIEAYEFIANEIISAYSRSLALDNNLGGVDNEIKALEFLNQAMYNFEIYTVNRERMKINVTDKEFDRKSEIRDSILNKSRIKKEAENLISSEWKGFLKCEKIGWKKIPYLLLELHL